MGLEAGCAIRVSLPWNAAPDAAERFLEAWSAMRARLSRRAA
jgi:cysteine desulfurase